MCDRYSLAVDLERVVEGPSEPSVELAFWSHRNIAPGQEAPVLVRRRSGVSVALLHWGLIPNWSSHPCPDFAGVNARAESLATEMPFRSAFKRRPCAVPTDGFYLWREMGETRIPWRFCRADGRIFLMAGLWSSWVNPEDGSPFETFAIVTVAQNPSSAVFQGRLPAVLTGEAAPTWLDPHASPDARLAALRPPAAEFLTSYQVSPLVNDPINQGPECWIPVQ